MLTSFYFIPKGYNKYCRRFHWLEDQEILNFVRLPREQKKAVILESKLCSLENF